MAVFPERKIALPDRVNYVNYIQSSGEQYINTGFCPTQDTRFVLDADILSTNNSGAAQIASCTDGTRYFVLRINSGFTAYQARRGTRSLFTISHDNDLYGRHVFDLNKSKITVDTAVTNDSDATFTVGQPLYICCQNNNGSTTGPSKIRIYSCKIYDNGTLVRDYKPCYDLDGVACLYDKVGKKYVYNAGTGAFTAG